MTLEVLKAPALLKVLATRAAAVAQWIVATWLQWRIIWRWRGGKISGGSATGGDQVKYRW